MQIVRASRHDTGLTGAKQRFTQTPLSRVQNVRAAIYLALWGMMARMSNEGWYMIADPPLLST